jgi:hypothetical protein
MIHCIVRVPDNSVFESAVLSELASGERRFVWLEFAAPDEVPARRKLNTFAFRPVAWRQS